MLVKLLGVQCRMAQFSLAAFVMITLQLSKLQTLAWIHSSPWRYSCSLPHNTLPTVSERSWVGKHALRRSMIDRTMATSTLINKSIMTNDSKLYAMISSQRTMISSQRTPEEIHMTEDIEDIIKEAIHSVDPVVAIQRSLFVSTTSNQPTIHISNRQNSTKKIDSRIQNTVSYQLDKYDTISVIGIGKAASSMVSAVLEIIVDAVDTMKKSTMPQQDIPKVNGIVLTKYGHITKQQREFFKTVSDADIVVHEASHPIPCDAGRLASSEIMNLVSSRNYNDPDDINSSNSKHNHHRLVIACISGGGSALFCTPKSSHNITLNDIQVTNTVLLQTGWPISAMNVIRTVLEYGKGGGLAEAALQSQSSDVVSFILSDVVGDPIDIIASGPTVVRSEEEKQRAIQKAYELVHHRTPSPTKFPNAVVDFLKQEHESLALNATTKINEHNVVSDNTNRQHCFNCIVGNNGVAVEAAALKAKALGYYPIILTSQLQGEASVVAQMLVSLAKNIQQPTTSFTINQNNQFPVALIVGGETTVTLPSNNHGKGGRNQELALAAAIALLENDQLRQIVVASVGTDGNDGPTDAAGAIVDGGTVNRLDAAGDSSLNLLAKDALQFHNAYSYLSQKDTDNHSPLLKTGPTGTNVADIIIFLIHKSETTLNISYDTS